LSEFFSIIFFNVFFQHTTMAEPPVKRYRKERKASASEDDFSKEGEGDVLYVPVRERRKQKLVKLGRIAVLKAQDGGGGGSTMDLMGSSGASSAAEDNESKEDIIK
jgi:hypothetical protein